MSGEGILLVRQGYAGRYPQPSPKSGRVRHPHQQQIESNPQLKAWVRVSAQNNPVQLRLKRLVEETFAGQDVQTGPFDSYFYGVVAFRGFVGLGNEGYGVLVAGFFG